MKTIEEVRDLREAAWTALCVLANALYGHLEVREAIRRGERIEDMKAELDTLDLEAEMSPNPASERNQQTIAGVP